MAMWSVFGVISLLIALISILLPVALVVALQVWLCRRKTRWLGLILPVLSFLFSLLLAANALLELLTEQRVKSWVWLLNVAGIVGCVADLFHCKNLRVAKAEDKNA